MAASALVGDLHGATRPALRAQSVDVSPHRLQAAATLDETVNGEALEGSWSEAWQAHDQVGASHDGSSSSSGGWSPRGDGQTQRQRSASITSDRHPEGRDSSHEAPMPSAGREGLLQADRQRWQIARMKRMEDGIAALSPDAEYEMEDGDEGGEEGEEGEDEEDGEQGEDDEEREIDGALADCEDAAPLSLAVVGPPSPVIASGTRPKKKKKKKSKKKRSKSVVDVETRGKDKNPAVPRFPHPAGFVTNPIVPICSAPATVERPLPVPRDQLPKGLLLGRFVDRPPPAPAAPTLEPDVPIRPATQPIALSHWQPPRPSRAHSVDVSRKSPQRHEAKKTPHTRAKSEAPVAGDVSEGQDLGLRIGGSSKRVSSRTLGSTRNWITLANKEKDSKDEEALDPTLSSLYFSFSAMKNAEGQKVALKNRSKVVKMLHQLHVKVATPVCRHFGLRYSFFSEHHCQAKKAGVTVKEPLILRKKADDGSDIEETRWQTTIRLRLRVHPTKGDPQNDFISNGTQVAILLHELCHLKHMNHGKDFMLFLRDIFAQATKLGAFDVETMDNEIPSPWPWEREIFRTGGAVDNETLVAMYKEHKAAQRAAKGLPENGGEDTPPTTASPVPTSPKEPPAETPAQNDAADASQEALLDATQSDLPVSQTTSQVDQTVPGTPTLTDDELLLRAAAAEPSGSEVADGNASPVEPPPPSPPVAPPPLPNGPRRKTKNNAASAPFSLVSAFRRGAGGARAVCNDPDCMDDDCEDFTGMEMEAYSDADVERAPVALRRSSSGDSVRLPPIAASPLPRSTVEAPMPHVSSVPVLPPLT